MSAGRTGRGWRALVAGVALGVAATATATDDADPDDLNLVHALTAGFEEPFALSVFLGNVADYGVPGKPEVLGRRYLGAVLSGGPFHLKDDRAIEDPWLEAEVKLKGDRRSPLRHFFLVDKKWPLTRPRVALVLGAGFLWEAGAACRGVLDDGRGRGFTALLRPNLEFQGGPPGSLPARPDSGQFTPPWRPPPLPPIPARPGSSTPPSSWRPSATSSTSTTSSSSTSCASPASPRSA